MKRKIEIGLLVVLITAIASLLFIKFTQPGTRVLGGGSGTISQLDQFRATSSPFSAITTAVSGKNLYFPNSNGTSSKWTAGTFCLTGDTCVTTWPGNTYTATGTLLDLTGTEFSVNEGTLTNGKICTYVTGTGLVCDYTDIAGSGATTTINGYSGPDFTFSTSSDTNIGLSITGSGSTLTFTPSWIGTLASSRIASSSVWDTAYTDRLKWDGGSTGLTAATGRTSLGLDSMALLANTGSSTITTLGTITSGIWNGTAITSTYIASSSNWDAKADYAFGANNFLGTGNFNTSGTISATTTTTTGTSTATNLKVTGVFTLFTQVFTDLASFVTYIRGLITENITGASFSSGQLSLDAGYEITKTASSSNWELAYASTTAMTPTYIRGLFSETVTGLDYSAGVFSLTSGYMIPTTGASTTWDTAYTDRLKWDGGSTGLVAATGRTSLGLGTMSLEPNTGSTTITTLGTIITGIWNGTSLSKIATSTNPTINAGNTLGINTTAASSSVRYYDGTAERALFDVQEKCFTTASTTFGSYDDIPLWLPERNLTVTSMTCKASGGTSVVATLSDGTNNMDSLTCATTKTDDDGTIANASVTSGEQLEVDFGTVTGTVNWVNYCISYRYEAD